MNDDIRFEEYWRYIDDCVRQVQSELALGNIKSEDTLFQVIDRIADFICSTEAFAFFKNAPYEWSDFVCTDLMEARNYDLDVVVLEVVNQQVCREVNSKLEQTDGYRFLMGDKRTKEIEYVIERESLKITMNEHWKARAEIFGHLIPFEMKSVEGKELTVFHDSESNSYSFLLEHEDPTLIWRSKSYQLANQRSIEEFEAIKCTTLLKYGCPREDLWLTECQTVETFSQYFPPYGEAAIEYYDLSDKKNVVYYHESGEVHCHAGFNTDDEFKCACRSIAEYLK